MTSAANEPVGAAELQICKPHCNKTKQSSEGETPSLPLVKVIKDNFPVSSLFTNKYPMTNSNKTNDTITTTDITNTSQSFDREKNGEFASFLASQQFDASAIITSGDDGEACTAVQDVNISGISDNIQIIYYPPIDDTVEPAPRAVTNGSDDKKHLVAVPDIDGNGDNANDADQKWWNNMSSSIQALWKQIVVSDHCNCMVDTVWHPFDDAEKTHRTKVDNDITESNNIVTPLKLDKSMSTSFVIAEKGRIPTTPRSPLQKKVASTPVETTTVGTPKPCVQSNHYITPTREDYIESKGSSNSIKRTLVTSNSSELSYRSVVTPLIGEHLVSTPQRGEDNCEISTLSQASSHLFGADISKTSSYLQEEEEYHVQHAKHCPPPSHLLPAKNRKELLFASTKQVGNAKVESKSTRETSREEKVFGLARSDKLLKRVKERRRQLRIDQ